MGLWRRKQSASSGESSNVSGTVTPVSSEGQDLSKTPSRLMKTLTVGLRSSKPKKPKESPNDFRLNRPFTEQNLEHQKIFDAFTFSFGRRKLSHGGRSNISGISPSASRNNSVDSAALPLSNHHQHHGDRRDTHPRFNNSLVDEAPQEVPGEESDRENRDDPTSAFPGAPRIDASPGHRNLS
ncbi:hypothetical protein SCUP234_11670 [Seiridium cupressi]